MAARLPKPEPEYEFHPIRKWAFDYAWPEWKIAFEVEGGAFGNAVHVGQGAWTLRRRKDARGNWIKVRHYLDPGTVVRVGGRHNSGVGLEGDAEKYNAAAIMGWTLIRATSKMVTDGRAIDTLEAAFRAKGFRLEGTHAVESREDLVESVDEAKPLVQTIHSDSDG